MVNLSGKSKYLMSIGELKRKDNSIVFKNEKGNNYISEEGIHEIYCMNEVTLNTKFLDFASKAGIVIHFFNYYGDYSGTFYPKEQLISGKLKIKQCEAYKNNREEIAKAIVIGISKNIYEVLYHYYKHGCKEIKETLDWIKDDVPRMLNKAMNIKQILFVEGFIWQKFYDTFKYFLNDEFTFNKRTKRPPENPLNALISFGNSLLYAKTVSQIYNTHLDQAISFLHEPSEGRFSLSLDLSEVFKPIIVFKSIFNLVNNRILQVNKHFDKKMNYCILNDTGRKIFIGEIEERFNNVFFHKTLNRKTTYFNAIKLDSYKLIKFLLEDKDFVPFSLKEMV